MPSSRRPTQSQLSGSFGDFVLSHIALFGLFYLAGKYIIIYITGICIHIVLLEGRGHEVERKSSRTHEELRG